MSVKISKNFLIERICKRYRIAKSNNQRLHVLPRILLNGVYYVFDTKKRRIYAYDPFTGKLRIEKDSYVYDVYETYFN